MTTAMSPADLRSNRWMLAPFVVLFLLVAGWPLARSIWWAVHDGRSLTSPPVFTLTRHLSRIGSDSALWFAVANTLAFTVIFVGLLLPIALGLALLLNSGRVIARGALRTLFFATHLIGPVYVAGIVIGIVSGNATGGSADALNEPLLAMPIVLVACLWMAAGWAMTYFLAALQSVDGELLDAAQMDGAGAAAVFRHITWPAIRATVLFVGFVAAAGALQLFELPFVLFQGPGPGNAALTLSMYLFSVAFEQGDLGYATAIGWLLALIVTAVSAAALRKQAETP